VPPIRLHDTLLRKKVELHPLEPGHVRMYACGPTVYGEIHLGNARPLVTFDLVARHLRARGLRVTYVRNITDVDDKIIRRAAELGEPPGALTERYIALYQEYARALGCEPPTHEPRVTTHIAEIIGIIEQLIARGVAYASDGDVYFAVDRFEGYGRLSHQPLAELQAGARVDVGEKKRAPLDFALWKAAKPGEPSWPSPFGPGRPGWHIECSAMAEKLLGTTFDLHGGGVDLIFPHHENERAQSQGVHGEESFARHWMHNGFVNFNGGKISKSDKAARVLFERAFRVGVLLERHGGETLRWFLLSSHYASPINFEVTTEGGDDYATARLGFPSLEEHERKVAYAYETLTRLRDQLSVGKPAEMKGPTLEAGEAPGWLERLRLALDDDFNSALAFAALGEALALCNRILDGKVDAPKDVRRRSLERLDRELREAAAILGVLGDEPAAWLAQHRARRCAARGIDASTVEAHLVRRAEARQAKDFAAADGVREQLRTMGVEIMDTPKGTTWKVGD
jgi:cysteinyl-tRNA synthetase